MTILTTPVTAISRSQYFDLRTTLWDGRDSGECLTSVMEQLDAERSEKIENSKLSEGDKTPREETDVLCIIYSSLS